MAFFSQWRRRMGTSVGPGTHGTSLKRPPSPLVWKVLLAIGVVARIAGESQASEARDRANAEAARIANEKAREVEEKARIADSIRLAAVVDSGLSLPRERLWQLDWTLHSARFVIPHDLIHRRV